MTDKQGPSRQFGEGPVIREMVASAVSKWCAMVELMSFLIDSWDGDLARQWDDEGNFWTTSEESK